MKRAKSKANSPTPKMPDDYSALEKHLGFKIDPWHGISGSKFKDHFAALGMISVDWKACEEILRMVVNMYLELPENYSPILLRHLNSVSLLDILIECSEIEETDPHFKKAISRFRDFFDRCRANKNDIIHSLAEYRYELVMQKPVSRRSKKMNEFVVDPGDFAPSC